MSDEIIVINMQSPLPIEYARSISADYDGNGFWKWNGKKYVWINQESKNERKRQM